MDTNCVVSINLSVIVINVWYILFIRTKNYLVAVLMNQVHVAAVFCRFVKERRKSTRAG